MNGMDDDKMNKANEKDDALLYEMWLFQFIMFRNYIPSLDNTRAP